METSDLVMRGRICAVTGATSGIGAVTAVELAARGATVIGIGRDKNRCASREQAIRAQTGNPNVTFYVADLSSQLQVREVARRILDDYPHLHVLVNNVGGIFPTMVRSGDGIEMTFALNHLAPFLLTSLLLDRLKASAPARIIVVASASHAGATLDLARLDGPPGVGGRRTYGQSKLANLYFTYELARRLTGTGVTVNAVHPGVVASNFGRSAPGIVGRLMAGAMLIGSVFSINVEEGAQTSVYLATSPEVEGVTGKYFTKSRPVESSPASHDAVMARQLWDVSLAMTGLAP